MLIPASFAEHTVESLYAEQGGGPAWLYRLLLLGVVGAVVSLPLIKVDVSVRAPGMVRPATERTDLRFAVSGRIEQVLVRDNETVEKGQTMVVLAATDLDQRLARNDALRRERTEMIDGLVQLVAATQAGEAALPSAALIAALQQEFAHYSAQHAASRLAADKARGELARYATLARKGIATEQELETARYEWERAEGEARLLAAQTWSRWQIRLREERTALADLESEEQRLKGERAYYVLRAPASGALLGFGGWSPGMYVTAGQAIGAISPDDALLVETHVASRDIGLVRLGQTARLQVDAYPYTDWGTLEGTVMAISGDWVGGESAAGARPVFKVMVRPATLQLTLPGGARGRLKKGLTLAARFLVARRSLLQLLYDDANAWFNPHDQRQT